MLDQYDKITEATAFIRERWSLTPRVAIILGSGLGGISGALADAVTIPYDEIPHFARSTAHGSSSAGCSRESRWW
jgi:purine-nucleoside phosphorylase